MRPYHRNCGFTIIELIVAIAVIAVLVILSLAAVQKARAFASSAKCQNNIRQAALALHQYHDSNGQFPMGHRPLSLFSSERMPLTGWSISLLPYLEQDSLYQQSQVAFRRSFLPFNDPPHRALSTVLVLYVCPDDSRIKEPQVSERTKTLVAFTSYLGVSGRSSITSRDGVLYQGSRTRVLDITDGTSSTLLLGERPPSADYQFGWWYAGTGQRLTGSADIVLGVREPNLQPITVGSPCGPGNYPFMPATGFNDPCGMFHFWSPHSGGANFAFADGSVRFLRYEAEPIMPALASRAGGETVVIPD